MREDLVEGPGNAAEVERVHEQARVQALAARPGPHEPAQLPLRAAALLRGLSLEHAERPDLALRLDDTLDRVGAEGADQLVLQVGDADEEAERLHAGAGQARAKPSPFESPPEVAFLRDVAQAGQPDVEPMRAKPANKALDVGRAAHRGDRDAVSIQSLSAPPGQCLERGLITHALDEDHRVRLDDTGRIDAHDPAPAIPCGGG